MFNQAFVIIKSYEFKRRTFKKAVLKKFYQFFGHTGKVGPRPLGGAQDVGPWGGTMGQGHGVRPWGGPME